MSVAKQTLEDFCSQLAAGTPAPGGGAAAAVAGALGAALVGMVAGLTVGRPRYAAAHDEMTGLQDSAKRLTAALLTCADADQAAFERVMVAYALPKGSDERVRSVRAGYQAASEVPLDIMQHSIAVMRGALAAAVKGNRNAISDAYVGYLAASTAFEGALWTTAMNLEHLDEEVRTEMLGHIRRLRTDRADLAEEFKRVVPDPLVGVQ